MLESLFMPSEKHTRQIASRVKDCTGCKKEIPWSGFYKQRDGRFGLTAKCKPCRNARQKELYVPKPPKKSAHPHVCEFCQKDFVSSHKRSRFCAATCKTKFAYARDREAVIQRVRRWERENPDQVFVKQVERTNRRRKRIEGVFSVRDWKRLVNRHNGICAYCRVEKDETLTVEHVVPISRGGKNTIGNILPACRDCNLSKNNRTIMEWRARKTLVESAQNAS